MGSGVSSSKASLSEVGIKNEIGVLYDASAKQAFDAAATEGPDGTPVAAWPAIEAHAKQHDERALDPRKCMYQNLKAFKAAREQIDEIARVHIKGAVREIPWVGKNLGDECRQCGLDGKPAESLDALYEVAALATVEFKAILTGACPEGVELKLAPLKGRGRAGAKARDEYANKTAPCFSWLFDITRGSALCQSENDIVKFYKALEADPRVDIVRTKNRFAPPLFNGYQDILMNVAVKVENVTHLCELQIHLMPIKDSEALHKSHTVPGAVSLCFDVGVASRRRREDAAGTPSPRYSTHAGLRVLSVVFLGQFRRRRAAARNAVQVARRRGGGRCRAGGPRARVWRGREVARGPLRVAGVHF